MSAVRLITAEEYDHLRNRITEMEATIERLKAIADSQASVLRGLTEWAEALPEQARDIWARTE